jgi:hypothetical protein
MTESNLIRIRLAEAFAVTFSPPTPAMSLAPGTRQGAYEVLATFGWGPPRPLLSLPKGTTLFALTNDRKRILAATPVETHAPPRPLTVILNWLNGADQPAAPRR